MKNSESNIMEVLKQKFTSSNDIPVSRAAITREEYEQLLYYIRMVNEGVSGIPPEDYSSRSERRSK